jgi:hypothetical protein
MKCVRLCDVPAGCCKKLCPSSKVIYYIDRDTYIWGKLCVNKCGSTIKIRNESRLKFYDDILGKECELIIRGDYEWNQGVDCVVVKLMNIEPNITVQGLSNSKDAVLQIDGGQGSEILQLIASKINIKGRQSNWISINNVDADIDTIEIHRENPSELLKKFSQQGYGLQVSNSTLNVSKIDIKHNGESLISFVGPVKISVEKQATLLNDAGAAFNYMIAELGDKVEFQEGAWLDINTKRRSIGLASKTMNAYSDDEFFVQAWPKTDAGSWIIRHATAADGNILVEEESEEEDD